MIQYLDDLPSNIVGFKATGEITESDFADTVMPKVKTLIERTDKLNYLLVLETSVVDAIRTFTDFFSYLMPGEFKGFEHKDLQEAIDWVAGETD